MSVVGDGRRRRGLSWDYVGRVIHKAVGHRTETARPVGEGRLFLREDSFSRRYNSWRQAVGMDGDGSVCNRAPAFGAPTDRSQ